MLCSVLGSDYAQPITGQVTEVSCPVIGWAQPELTVSKRQKMFPVQGQQSGWLDCSILTHWGRVTLICVCKLTIIGSDNGLSPEWRQAIIWTNAGILLIGTLGTNFSEILIEIQTFSLKEMRLKVSFAKRRPFCLSVLTAKHIMCMLDYSH